MLRPVTPLACSKLSILTKPASDSATGNFIDQVHQASAQTHVDLISIRLHVTGHERHLAIWIAP